MTLFLYLLRQVCKVPSVSRALPMQGCSKVLGTSKTSQNREKLHGLNSNCLIQAITKHPRYGIQAAKSLGLGNVKRRPVGSLLCLIFSDGNVWDVQVGSGSNHQGIYLHSFLLNILFDK